MTDSLANCPFCNSQMESGYAWVTSVIGGGLCWQKTKPELSALRPSPGEVVVHSHVFRDSQSLRPAYRCSECESVTIQTSGEV